MKWYCFQVWICIWIIVAQSIRIPRKILVLACTHAHSVWGCWGSVHGTFNTTCMGACQHKYFSLDSHGLCYNNTNTNPNTVVLLNKTIFHSNFLLINFNYFNNKIHNKTITFPNTIPQERKFLVGNGYFVKNCM